MKVSVTYLDYLPTTWGLLFIPGKDNMKHCPVCNRLVPRGHGYKSNQVYCSIECFAKRNILDKEKIIQELNKTNNVTVTAELMGVGKQTLYRWLKDYKIKRKVVWE
jgi:predicted nucleic acid-binding Zn ribbon protein